MPRDTLFYDGQCPLCSVEMKKLRQQAGQQIQLVDIHSLSPSPELPDKNALLRSLHLQKANGDLLQGIEANVAAWQHTRLGIFWRWLRWPVIKPLANFCYHYWAERRYQQLYPNPHPTSTGKD
ncbi:thiol-disulfide oxidoreductase DCC family protein [Oceanicoccus sagamiensis]|uniref:Thiol-disulfide oxidoreductase n=1 Tax=Oceanicoccus sagamiensis TaxID=716816 RepID=A0A1X9NEA0_9GAMM|nr:DUF393 domain-containing protein [Oceanicoccus sagamiensis]ARN75481.1 hypothetical protein BST96_16005 [Oceanicoccus sagamiensis]